MQAQKRVALVTGAARRVGRAIALEMARAGCDVAVHFRASAHEAEDVAALCQAAGSRTITVQADLHDTSSCGPLVGEVVNQLGRIDYLINNASDFLTSHPDTIDGFDAALWERMLRVNLIAPAALAHHAADQLRRTRGAIVNLCDTSWDRPWPDHLAYGASKGGLVALTRALARALAPEVRVNAVSPGIAVFPESYDSATRRRLVERVPLGTEGTPESIARLVRYLCEDGAYITGQVVTCDGGRNVV